MKRVNFKIQDQTWVIRKKDLREPMYGYVEFVDGDRAAVKWGWRIGGGSEGAIENLDDLLPVAPPSRVCDFARKAGTEAAQKFKKKFGVEYAYDAAAMEIMRFIYQEMYEEDF